MKSIAGILLMFGSAFAARTDPVSVAMLEMRLIATVVESHRQQSGTYPDTALESRPVREVFRTRELPAVDPGSVPSSVENENGVTST